MGAARADVVSDKRAREIYQKGKAAFAHRDFQSAYDHFKQAFALSSDPAFMFNMASALQELGRWSEAAEVLRAFLRVRPGDNERPLIEERIRALEEKQRLLEIDRPAPILVPVPPPKPPDPRALKICDLDHGWAFCDQWSH